MDITFVGHNIMALLGLTVQALIWYNYPQTSAFCARDPGYQVRWAGVYSVGQSSTGNSAGTCTEYQVVSIRPPGAVIDVTVRAEIGNMYTHQLKTKRNYVFKLWRGRGVAQAAEHSPVKVGIIWLSLYAGCICSLSYFLFQPVVHNWSIKGCSMCCPVCGKVHKKIPCCLSETVAYVVTSGFI